MYDLLIKNGEILDGTGAPALRADIAVKDGKIAKIARSIGGEAARVIDAAGSPAFDRPGTSVECQAHVMMMINRCC